MTDHQARERQRLWRAMQYIEHNRHIAETLEARAPAFEPTNASLLMCMAAQHRQLAEQMYALWSGGAPEPAVPVGAWPAEIP